jgi:hypothetical protein
LRDQEATPPRKEAPVTLDEDEKNDDAPKGRKNKGRPDGRREEKIELKKKARQERLREKIDEMINSK